MAVNSGQFQSHAVGNRHRRGNIPRCPDSAYIDRVIGRRLVQRPAVGKMSFSQIARHVSIVRRFSNWHGYYPFTVTHFRRLFLDRIQDVVD